MVDILSNIDKIVWGTPLVVLLISTHIFLTFKLKFPQKNIFKGLSLMFKPTNTKGISSFNSLMTVLAATIRYRQYHRSINSHYIRWSREYILDVCIRGIRYIN